MWQVIEYSTHSLPQVRSEHRFKFMASFECRMYELFGNPWSRFGVEKARAGNS